MSWLVEEGIGEQRAILLGREHVKAARIYWPGELTPGQVDDAILLSRAKGNGRGVVRFPGGEEALADRLPRNASEGAAIRMKVLRPKAGEGSRVKLAQARPTEDELRPAPSLVEMLEMTGMAAKPVHRFPANAWTGIFGEVLSGVVNFPGGSLTFSPTPAMTLVDVDGTLPPRELALSACAPLGQAIAQFGLSGSIGIDFPTLETKADRKAVDHELANALTDWDHERTAMNGFGFVQLVGRVELPSLLHRATYDRTAACARLLLRRGEDVSHPGAILLTAHPAVLNAIRDDWLSELQQRSGRELRTSPNPALALEGCFAQALPA